MKKRGNVNKKTPCLHALSICLHALSICLYALSIVLPAALLFSGCLVKEKCYNDSDCFAPAICKDGKCVIECEEDEDCDDAFGVEYVCEENHCIYPAECATCSFSHADASCVHGECLMTDCHDGYYDINEDDEDGCEYECTPSNGGVETCDETDNDCDGQIDEGFDFSSDPLNCGGCGNRCSAGAHADPVCASGTCSYVCHDGWYDNNGLADDGCEDPECVPVDEVCDGRDNDCDCPGDTNDDTIKCGPGDEGVDEGFDKTQPETCGPFCVECDFFHAEPLCIDGECAMGECEEGWNDIDGREFTGCEYECTETNGGVEICDALDNDCDGRVDEGDVCGAECPLDMVPVGSSFCIDIYEASRTDATIDNQGVDESRAFSRPGVLPWMVNPMTAEHFLTFQAACEAAGKRICTKAEWYSACRGPSPGTTYVYGNIFNQETCNTVDTFCDDYCEANGIPAGECNTGPNCGYAYYCFHEVPTAQFTECTNDYGTYDINGNMWEIVPSDTDPRGYEVRGGAFNCASAMARVSCEFNAGWAALYAGFRCCMDAP